MNSSAVEGLNAIPAPITQRYFPVRTMSVEVNDVLLFRRRWCLSLPSGFNRGDSLDDLIRCICVLGASQGESSHAGA